MTAITTGDGWAVGSLDATGEGPRFPDVRAFDVKEFRVNAIVIPPGYETGVHWHDRVV
jgi:hypothetical protein